MKKIVSLLLALVMVFSLAACTNGGETVTTNPPEETNSQAPGGEETDVYTGPDWAAIDAMDHYDASDAVYDWNLGVYAEYYARAKEEISNLDLRMALMAVAEAKAMEAAMFMPYTADGGNFAMTRAVPRASATSTLWGLDMYRNHTRLVVEEPIKAADYNELLTLWGAAETAEKYHADAKAYLAEHGYTLKDSYTYYNNYEIETWDIIASSYSSDSYFIAGTYDGLLEYDCRGALQPGLAEKYEVSADGLTYTFHIRQGVQWVDQQGTPIGEVTADDWVASMAHMIDNNDALGYLMTSTDGCGIKNYDAYLAGEVSDFAEVGVKAVDKYTLEYTLEAPFAPFLTMFGYGCFAPLNRDFYTSQGGTFSVDGVDYTRGNYGKTPSNIAYCGPFLITNFTAKNTIKYEANPTYWNAGAMNIHSWTWYFNDGTDTMRSYNEFKSGVVDGVGLNSSALVQARQDIPDGETETWFDLYGYATEAGPFTYNVWFNVNRKSWANYNDEGVGVSPMKDNEEEHARTRSAVNNQNFRLAVDMAMDRGALNAASVGEELKLISLRNSYTPATYLMLNSEVTVDINGTPTTFPAGTAYGAIEQAQLDADGYPIKVWDEAALSGDGFDGWYNASNAKAYLEKAIAELTQIGVEISAEKPIYLDFPYGTYSEVSVNRANVVKQSIENVLEGKVIVNLVGYDDSTAMTYAYYRVSSGSETNLDFLCGSGWGPDYGDPQSYLDTAQPYGYMCKNMGVY